MTGLVGLAWIGNSLLIYAPGLTCTQRESTPLMFGLAAAAVLAAIAGEAVAAYTRSRGAVKTALWGLAGGALTIAVVFVSYSMTANLHECFGN
ncbi:MAG TPA: hypothetical protein VII98_12350 [Solirubrobacteraceae bacterium]